MNENRQQKEWNSLSHDIFFGGYGDCDHVCTVYVYYCFFFLLFSHIIMCSCTWGCYISCKKLCWSLYFYSKWDPFVNRTARKTFRHSEDTEKMEENELLIMHHSSCLSSPCASCLLVNILVNAEYILKKQVSKLLAFPVVSRSAWHSVPHPEKNALEKTSRSFSLHHHRLPTACDTSFLSPAHLPS